MSMDKTRYIGTRAGLPAGLLDTILAISEADKSVDDYIASMKVNKEHQPFAKEYVAWVRGGKKGPAPSYKGVTPAPSDTQAIIGRLDSFLAKESAMEEADDKNSDDKKIPPWLKKGDDDKKSEDDSEDPKDKKKKKKSEDDDSDDSEDKKKDADKKEGLDALVQSGKFTQEELAMLVRQAILIDTH